MLNKASSSLPESDRGSRVGLLGGLSDKLKDVLIILPPILDVVHQFFDDKHTEATDLSFRNIVGKIRGIQSMNVKRDPGIFNFDDKPAPLIQHAADLDLSNLVLVSIIADVNQDLFRCHAYLGNSSRTYALPFRAT
jgi:hypothetical protein